MSSLDPLEFVRWNEGLIASPPCQGFSYAGLRTGMKNDSTRILEAVQDMGQGKDPRTALRLAQADHRSVLVLEPLRWAMAVHPKWMAWEQVPAVLPLWQACAQVLRERGYSVWTGILNAEAYGVAQTRTRAVLLASALQDVTQPAPTHSKYHKREPEQLDHERRWMAMCEVVPGWQATDLIGFPRLADTPSNRSGDIAHLGGVDYRGRDLREGTRPAWAITEKARSWKRWTGPDEEPTRVTLAEAARLQSFPAAYRWTGSYTSTFHQLGNAVPPLLSAHALTALNIGRHAIGEAA